MEKERHWNVMFTDGKDMFLNVTKALVAIVDRSLIPLNGPIQPPNHSNFKLMTALDKVLHTIVKFIHSSFQVLTPDYKNLSNRHCFNINKNIQGSQDLALRMPLVQIQALW
jgi:hypothetical protein